MPIVSDPECVVPEKIHTLTPWKVIRNSWGGEVLKAKFVEEMYENKLEFPGGGRRGGAKQKTFRGGVWTFSGTAQ